MLKSLLVNLLRLRSLPKGSVHIGPYSSGNPHILSFDKNDCVVIGKFCMFGSDVSLIVGGGMIPNRGSGHSRIMNYHRSNLDKSQNKNSKDAISESSSGFIVIGNDVRVGARAIIMPNVTIGDGAIIGAGAVVTHDIPPYGVACGVPARIIKYRFSKIEIEELLQIAWWNWPKEKIVANLHNLRGADVESLIINSHVN
jgi:virginiamycin A acetyltransferase